MLQRGSKLLKVSNFNTLVLKVRGVVRPFTSPFSCKCSLDIEQNRNRFQKYSSFWVRRSHRPHGQRVGGQWHWALAFFVTDSQCWHSPAWEGQNLSLWRNLVTGPKEAVEPSLPCHLLRHEQTASSKLNSHYYPWVMAHWQKWWKWGSWVDEKAF